MSDLRPVLSDSLSDLPGINHAFFTRPGGVSSGIYAGLNAGLGSKDDRATVVENRHRMVNWLGGDAERLASPWQIHSPDCVTTSIAWPQERPRADGVATATPGLAVGVVTADCGPVLFADPSAGVVAACHAGWNGALNGILEDTIDKMETLGATRDGIVAVLGPTISRRNYEVGPAYPEPFLRQSTDNESYFTPSDKDGHFMFDLPGYIVDRLKSAGVRASWTGQCTYADENDFFSYRRTTHRGEADYGRQLSAIMLNGT